MSKFACTELLLGESGKLAVSFMSLLSFVSHAAIFLYTNMLFLSLSTPLLVLLDWKWFYGLF